MTSAMQADGVADLLRQHAIQNMLIEESAALDRRDYRRWLTFFTSDVRYWMPIRATRAADDPRSEFTELGEPAFYDETFRELESRVVKLESGWSWSEDPPSRTRRFVTNLRVLETRSESDVTVETNILLYRGRLDNPGDLWSARRVDDLRRLDDSWKIAARSVFLDHTVLNANNLGVFF